LTLNILTGCRTSRKKEASPLSILFPYEWIGNIDQVEFIEPSGIVFYPNRGTLFVVGDEGDICEIYPDGTMVKQKRIRHADFEGITYDPSTGLLYIAVERVEKILEVSPEDFSVLREFPIDRTFRGAVVLKEGGQGIESISFVPDSEHPEGGTFFISNQGFTLDNREDPSALFEVEAPLRSGSGDEMKARILRMYSLGIIDLSGLHYDKSTDHLFVISDATNSLFEITRKGGIIESYAFPGDNQEGIAIDHEDNLYIAQDSGGIIKVKWLRGK
jgi:uncharacterized protein YjiK